MKSRLSRRELLAAGVGTAAALALDGTLHVEVEAQSQTSPLTKVMESLGMFDLFGLVIDGKQWSNHPDDRALDHSLLWTGWYYMALYRRGELGAGYLEKFHRATAQNQREPGLFLRYYGKDPASDQSLKIDDYLPITAASSLIDPNATVANEVLRYGERNNWQFHVPGSSTPEDQSDFRRLPWFFAHCMLAAGLTGKLTDPLIAAWLLNMGEATKFAETTTEPTLGGIVTHPARPFWHFGYAYAAAAEGSRIQLIENARVDYLKALYNGVHRGGQVLFPGLRGGPGELLFPGNTDGKVSPVKFFFPLRREPGAPDGRRSPANEQVIGRLIVDTTEAELSSNLMFHGDFPSYRTGDVLFQLWMSQKDKWYRINKELRPADLNTGIRVNLGAHTPADQGVVRFWLMALADNILQGYSNTVDVRVCSGGFRLTVTPSGPTVTAAGVKIDPANQLRFVVNTSAFLGKNVELLFRVKQNRAPTDIIFHRTYTEGAPQVERNWNVQRDLPVNTGRVTFQVEVSNLGNVTTDCTGGVTERSIDFLSPNQPVLRVTPQIAYIDANTQLTFHVHSPPHDQRGNPATFIFLGKQESSPKDFKVGDFTTDKGEVYRTWAIQSEMPANLGRVRFYVRVGDLESNEVPVEVRSVQPPLPTRPVAPTRVTVASASGQPGQTVTLTATLQRTDAGAALQGKPIQFFIAGTLIGTANTNAGGTATLAYRVPTNQAPGSYPIVAQFGADAEFSASQASGSLVVTAPTPTRITVSNAFALSGQRVSLRGTLIRSDRNQGLTGKVLVFYVNETRVGQATTNNSGRATLNYQVPSGLATGNRNLVVKFEGDTQYAPSAGGGTLTVISG